MKNAISTIDRKKNSGKIVPLNTKEKSMPNSQIEITKLGLLDPLLPKSNTPNAHYSQDKLITQSGTNDIHPKFGVFEENKSLFEHKCHNMMKDSDGT